MDNTSVNRNLKSTYGLTFGSLATTFFFVLLLCLFFAPRWESNDDVGMSMVAHGYGIAANSSYHLIFSNIIWGYIVRAIPEMYGVLGYSIATLGILVLVSAVSIYYLFRLGLGYVGCLFALILIFLRPVLFPQFTINAGLLMIAASLCWYSYGQHQDKRALLAGCLLAFCSYIVRNQAFFLILFVATPLLPWRALLLSRFAKITLSLFVLTIATATALNQLAYQSAEWHDFNNLNLVRARFTDFKAGESLQKRQDIIVKYGYSLNDIKLIDNWFFVDANLSNPASLQKMLTEAGPLATHGNALSNVWIGMKTLLHPRLFVALMAALFLFLLHPSRRGLASWGLCVAVIVVLSLLGRPGILHVYVPLIAWLLIVPFLEAHLSDSHKRLSVGILCVAAVFNAAHVFAEARISHKIQQHVSKAFTAFPTSSIVIWGSQFPFEFVYPVLGSSTAAMHYQLYALGTFTLAPFSIAYAEHKVGHGVIERLVSEDGIAIVANKSLLHLLEGYCKEHLAGNFKSLSTEQYVSLKLSRVRCEIS